MGEQTKTLTSMTDEFFALLSCITSAEDKVKGLKKQKDALQLKIIDVLNAEGMSQLKDASGRTVFLKEPRTYGSLNKENEKAAVSFLKRSWKLGFMFKESVSASALGRVIKDRLDKGLEVPEQFVTYYQKLELGYRKGSTKE